VIYSILIATIIVYIQTINLYPSSSVKILIIVIMILWLKRLFVKPVFHACMFPIVI